MATAEKNADIRKCQQIGDLIPTLAKAMRDIQHLNRKWESNTHLLQGCKTLGRLEGRCPKDMEEIAPYISDLTHGIECLTEFFNSLGNELSAMSDAQQENFGRLSGQAYKVQQEIVDIATE